jgi:DNA-binding NtrC family response regulator
MPADLRETDPLPSAYERSLEEKAFSILVVRDGETSTYPLSPGKSLIGRAREAQVRVDHGSVSREHAMLHVAAALHIEDLGSANGTRLRGVRLERGVPVEVFPDDVIDLGAVLLVVRSRRLVQGHRRTCDRAMFELRVEEECERVSRGGTPFAVARLAVQGTLAPHAVHLLVASALESDDLVAEAESSRYELLLLDVTPSEATRRVAHIGEVLTQRELVVRDELACCPQDGRTAEEILGRFVPHSSARSLPTGVVVRDEAMLRVFRLLERVAKSTLSVLLLGETGVGKEVCAKLVHDYSPRADAPFLGLNCAALSESLLESELFGYEKGAFTGAATDKPGFLESASGGTVFLDEVGDMPLTTQVKLLRVLEAKEVLRLGSRRARPIDIRVVAATNRDLEERITEGGFREDLFYRLNGISVIVPPLRERPDDIEPLARHFLERSKRRDGGPSLSDETVRLLESHPWPGNVRELRNLIERAVILCDGPVLEPRHLPLRTSGAPPRASLQPEPSSGGLRGEVKSLEKERIETALAACDGNQRRAAVKLGISRGALLRRIDQLGISRPKKGS